MKPVFLRLLEYYSGILFLTTNRVGIIDDAFKSRIHVHLYYPALEEVQTHKIWEINLKRTLDRKRNVDADMEDILAFAVDLHRKQKAEKQPVWNGRQIRNAVQTVTALAEFDSNKPATSEVGQRPKLKLEYFKLVANVLSQFDAYLKDVHGGAHESQLAERAELRTDERKSKNYNPTSLEAPRSHSDAFPNQQVSPYGQQGAFTSIAQPQSVYAQVPKNKPQQASISYVPTGPQVQTGCPFTVRSQEAQPGFIQGPSFQGQGSYPLNRQQGPNDPHLNVVAPQAQQLIYPSGGDIRQEVPLGYTQWTQPDMQQAPVANPQ